MSQHTPGPWTVVEDKANQYGRLDVTGCSLDITGFTKGPDATRKETTWADARLIAAAPELLAALQDVLDEPNDRNWSAARAAIRKATGEGTTAASAASPARSAATHD